jgi:hypothetical protein
VGSMRSKRGVEELEGIAREVQYEIDMMHHAARLLRSERDKLHKTFYLELFLLHLRNIRDFLYADPKHAQQEDVAAEDLVASADWPAIRPALGQTISSEKGRLNRALAHLSYCRLHYNKTGKAWFVGRMHKEIEHSLDAFFRAIPPERKLWFKSKYTPT